MLRALEKLGPETLTAAGVALGSALGGVLRYWLGGVVDRGVGETFPWGTLVVNVSGCFVIGLVFVASGTDGRVLLSPLQRQTIMVGVLGGYTTFSSFSLQTLSLARDGEWAAAAANVLLSVGLSLAAVWLGASAGAALNR